MPLDHHEDGLPDECDLNPFDDLDGRAACRHFLGKSLAEAEALFRENDIYYQEDLMWMGGKGFCFYVRAAMSYVRSGPGEAAEFLAHLIPTLEFRLSTDASELRPAAASLVEFLGELLPQSDLFSDIAVYHPKLRERIEHVRTMLVSLSIEKRSFGPP